MIDVKTDTETTAPAPEAPKVGPKTRAACDIAAGRAACPADAAAVSLTAAKKDLNSRGNGPEWHRMVYRDGEWRYFGERRLSAGKFLARDRRDEVSGDVYPGEIVAGHDRGGPVNMDDLYIARDGGLVKITAVRRKDGLAFTLPTGDVVVLPDPRAR